MSPPLPFPPRPPSSSPARSYIQPNFPSELVQDIPLYFRTSLTYRIFLLGWGGNPISKYRILVTRKKLRTKENSHTLSYKVKAALHPLPYSTECHAPASCWTAAFAHAVTATVSSPTLPLLWCVAILWLLHLVPHLQVPDSGASVQLCACGSASMQLRGCCCLNAALWELLSLNASVWFQCECYNCDCVNMVGWMQPKCGCVHTAYSSEKVLLECWGF